MGRGLRYAGKTMDAPRESLEPLRGADRPWRHVEGVRTNSSSLAAGCLFIGGFAMVCGTQPAFTLLWAALWVSLALGVMSILSIGAIYIVSGALIVLAISTTPNRSELESRFDRRYVLVEAVVFIAVSNSVVI